MGLNVGGHSISDIYVGNDKISQIFFGEDIVYSSGEDETITPLYFEAADPSATVTVGFRKNSDENFDDPSKTDFSKYTGYSDPQWSYSYDLLTWVNYSVGSMITLGANSHTRVYFKSRTNYTAIPWRGTYIKETEKITLTYNTLMQFIATGGDVKGGGNILSLLYSDFMNYDATLPYCYWCMFRGCTSLTSAPALPATTLAEYCYLNMFNGCTSLTSAPALPATTLAEGCYQVMFKGCTSLTSAPVLPATTLVAYCYTGMFGDCTSLISVPALPATTLATMCYYSMFGDCTSLTSAPALPATTLAKGCYSYMFQNCTSLTSAPALPATTLAESCYLYMLYNCALQSVPSLPYTGDLPKSAYNSCFSGPSADARGIRASNTQSSTCPYEYRIPLSGSCTESAGTGLSTNSMFLNESSSDTFRPPLNTIFYISVPVMN